MNRKEIFSKRLEKLLIDRDLSKTQLADHFKMSHTSISKWASATSYPTIEVLCQLSELLDASLDYLLGLSENKKRSLKQNNESQNIVSEPDNTHQYKKDVIDPQTEVIKTEVNNLKIQLVSCKEINDHKEELNTLYKREISLLKKELKKD